MPLKQDFDPKYPSLTAKYNVVFGLSKDAPELLKAFNGEIAEIWASCKNVEIGKKYGLSDPSWYEPGAVNLRAGKDRPADWQQPTSPAKCKG